MKIAIVDYGMGNIHSLKSALLYISPRANIALTNDGVALENSDLIFLPGVGHFKTAMDKLESLRLVKTLRELVLDKKKSIMGICLGMQLLFSDSSEGGINLGLGLLNGQVRYIADGVEKIPHIGFNTVTPPSQSRMFAGIDNLDFYFVHSYCVKDIGFDANTTTRCNHNEKFVAAIENGHIWGSQFHPEKSQESGLKLLENFINTHGH
jgi:imidazole glycerol-phosphate synthase subunit HisH